RQTIDSAAEVRRLNRYQHPHLRSDGNHARHRNAFTSATTFVDPFNRIVNRVPSGAATSTTTISTPGSDPTDGNPLSSTNSPLATGAIRACRLGLSRTPAAP